MNSDYNVKPLGEGKALKYSSDKVVPHLNSNIKHKLVGEYLNPWNDTTSKKGTFGDHTQNNGTYSVSEGVLTSTDSLYYQFSSNATGSFVGYTEVGSVATLILPSESRYYLAYLYGLAIGTPSTPPCIRIFHATNQEIYQIEFSTSTTLTYNSTTPSYVTVTFPTPSVPLSSSCNGCLIVPRTDEIVAESISFNSIGGGLSKIQLIPPYENYFYEVGSPIIFINFGFLTPDTALETLTITEESVVNTTVQTIVSQFGSDYLTVAVAPANIYSFAIVLRKITHYYSTKHNLHSGEFFDLTTYNSINGTGFITISTAFSNDIILSNFKIGNILNGGLDILQ